jgi:alpha,alpha-trehalase
MKKLFLLLSLYLLLSDVSPAQNVSTPDKTFGRLFIDVQMQRIFPDNKTFVDCIPKRDPAQILEDYNQQKDDPQFSLKSFVDANFIEPSNPADNFHTAADEDIKTHINRLWDVLKRNPDQPVTGSSLLALPNAYIVPGGRFREIYYWDSYFTMLGLQESNRYDLIESMVNNFAYLISQFGHIPNGNRSYYLSRSQPPYFSLMVELLAEQKGDQVYALYKDALQSEYDYWNDKTAETKNIVTMPDGTKLTRYFDQDEKPRQESFYEDSTLAIGYTGDRKNLYRNLRTCAESGWDFSTRWFADGEHLSTIQMTNLVPVDLNCLMYHLERTLAKAYRETGNLLQQNYYNQVADKRKQAINKYCYNKMDHWYYDYNISKNTLNTEKTIAGTTPLFLRVAPDAAAKDIAAVVEKDFLKAGGVVTTLKNSGEQWDAPNGWAPLEYIAIKGLDNYGLKDLAKEIASRWVDLNNKVYKATGKLMEKYNVTDTHITAGGGEYPSQDGFGWTNGVLLKLMGMYGLHD